MKTDGEVRQKIKQVAFRYLKKCLKQSLRQAPDTCLHNEVVDLRDGGSIGICRYTEAGVPRNFVCDEQVDDGARARACPLWEPEASKELVRQEFNDLMSGDRGTLASEYPDLAALLWVLNDDAQPEDAESVQDAQNIEEDPDAKGWDWGRWPPWRKRKS